MVIVKINWTGLAIVVIDVDVYTLRETYNGAAPFFPSATSPPSTTLRYSQIHPTPIKNSQPRHNPQLSSDTIKNPTLLKQPQTQPNPLHYHESPTKPSTMKLCVGHVQPHVPIKDDSPIHAHHPECQTCKRHTTPVKQHNDWIIPPEFDNQCPDKIKD